MSLLRYAPGRGIVPASTPRHHDPARRWRTTWRWQKLAAEQVARSPRCVACGSGERLTADHIVPVAAGGSRWDLRNLQTLCVRCNSAKGDRGGPFFRDGGAPRPSPLFARKTGM